MNDLRKTLEMIARDYGATLDGCGPSYTLDAPHGLVWTCDSVHGLAVDGDDPGALARVLERISYGLSRCTSRDRCDMCDG